MARAELYVVETEDFEAFLDRARAFVASGVDSADDETAAEEARAAAWEARVEPFLAQLPPEERRIYDLARRGLTHEEIAEVVEAHPRKVAWRIERARERLRALVCLPVWEGLDVSTLLEAAGVDEEGRRIVALWWTTSSQTMVARAVGRSQPYVQRRIVRTVEQLRAMASNAETDPNASESRRYVLRVVAEQLESFRRDGRTVRPGGGNRKTGATKAGVSKNTDCLDRAGKGKTA